MLEMRQQAINGITPPLFGKARIRESWPSVARNTTVANLGRILTRSIVLAPLAWLLMLPLYFSKLLPIVGRRYTLTNRGLEIRTAFSGKTLEEVPLADIDDVRIVTDANSDFFRAATLEILSGGQVRMRLPGMPEAEGFCMAILNARRAWAPRASDQKAFVAASATTAS